MLKKKLITFLAFISLSNCSSNNDTNETKENFEKLIEIAYPLLDEIDFYLFSESVK